MNCTIAVLPVSANRVKMLPPGPANSTMRETQSLLIPDALPESGSAQLHTSTFVSNLRLPVHRWFRYSAGFSAAWVEELVGQAALRGPVRVFDPFAGSGTALLAAEDLGFPSIGVEAHPFVYRVAQAKLHRLESVTAYKTRTRRILERAQSHSQLPPTYPPLIEKCYSPESLAKLHALRLASEESSSGSPIDDLAWLTLVGILRMTSSVGTAQWQYVLPKKEKRNAIDPFTAWESLAQTIARDMRSTQAAGITPQARLLCGDARICAGVPDEFATLVVTSPPYPNNYDYADATRLEMTFFGEIDGWGDLQEKVRKYLVRSCSQHVPPKAIDLGVELARPELAPIRDQIASTCGELARLRPTKGGKKTYDLMVACYFADLALVWRALRRVCAPGAQVCFVVGDSAPYGVYVPVIDWLGELALAAGFHSYRFEKIRDRNVKWKNRKHRVPLCEGRLWVQG